MASKAHPGERLATSGESSSSSAARDICAAANETSDRCMTTECSPPGQTRQSEEDEEEDHDKDDEVPVQDRPIVCLLEDVPDRTTTSATTNPMSPSGGKQQRQRCRMFRVVRSKGKALASGGFGVTVVTDQPPEDESQKRTSSGRDDDVDDDIDTVTEDGPTNSNHTATTDTKMEVNNKQVKEEADANPPTKKSTKPSAEYLFIEEVLFLHEKGLLRAMARSGLTDETGHPADDDAEPIDAATTGADRAERSMATAKPLDTSQLYQLLPRLGIDLAVYRVYSHLRSQDFRVLRHDPDRYEILCCQRDDQERRRQRKLEQRRRKPTEEREEQLPEDDEPRQPTTKGGTPKQSWKLRRKVRESIQNAPPPSIPNPSIHQKKSSENENDNDDGDTDEIAISWDVYNPNSNFGKTHPGLPDFYVTAAYYNVPTISFSDLKTLIRDKCHGIPLKVATVSDSGT